MDASYVGMPLVEFLRIVQLLVVLGTIIQSHRSLRHSLWIGIGQLQIGLEPYLLAISDDRLESS